MSKYKVGDKFEVEITTVMEKTNWPYMLKGMPGRYNDNYLDQLQKVNTENVSADEAWKIAKKLFAEFSDSELDEIFGINWSYPKLMELSPQEAKAKIEAWEAGKEVKVGDVVRAVGDGTKAVVLDEKGDALDVLTDSGCAEEWYKSKVAKTGCYIDIQSILKQIGGRL